MVRASFAAEFPTHTTPSDENQQNQQQHATTSPGEFACGVCRCVGDVLLVLRHTGRTPLVWASFNGHKEVVKLLLDSKANLEAKDKRGACVIRSGVPNTHNAE